MKQDNTKHSNARVRSAGHAAAAKGGAMLIMLLALMLFWAHAGAADDYLDAIDMEVEYLGAGGSRAVESPVSKPAPSKPVAKVAPVAAPPSREVTQDVAEFEEALLEQFPGTYLLYMKLDELNRQKVFAEYQSSGKYSSTRQKIIALNMR